MPADMTGGRRDHSKERGKEEKSEDSAVETKDDGRRVFTPCKAPKKTRTKLECMVFSCGQGEPRQKVGSLLS